MVKNSLMLFSHSPPKLFRLMIGVSPLPKTCSADCPAHPRASRPTHPKYTIHQQYPTPAPIHQLYTNYTPAIHQLYTNYTPTIHPPIPPPLRVDSDEMRQKPQGFGSEVLECSRASTKWTSTKWTPRVVQTRLELARCLFVASAGAQTKVDEECFSESCRVCAATTGVPAIFPKTTQIVKKLPN